MKRWTERMGEILSQKAFGEQGPDLETSLADREQLLGPLIKEFNRRVKGTEKFWNRPAGAEAILQVRAAILSDGDPLTRFIHSRPGQLHYRRASPTPPNHRT